MVQPLISRSKPCRFLPDARSFGMALAAASLLLVSACSQEQSQKAGTNAAALPKPEVGVVTLQPQSVSINAEMPGRTTASLVAEVRPQVGGIIEQRLFTEGSEVKEGDALYQIEPASYKAAYESAAADLQRAEATVPSAQSMVTRYQGLIKQNAVSKQDLDNAVASLAQAKADVADIEAKSRIEAAGIFKKAYTADPQLYMMLRSLDALSTMVNSNTTVVLRTDAAPFRALVDGPGAKAGK